MQVSGTPLGHGKLADVYGLMLFLRLEPWADKAWWQHAIKPCMHHAHTVRTPCTPCFTMRVPCLQVAARHQRAAHRRRTAPRRRPLPLQPKVRHASLHADAAWCRGRAGGECERRSNARAPICGLASGCLGPGCLPEL